MPLTAENGVSIATRHSGRVASICLRSVSARMSGMAESRTAVSMDTFLATSSASLPVLASVTVKPRLLRAAARLSRVFALLETTRKLRNIQAEI